MSISSDEPRNIEHSKKNIYGRLGLLPSHLDLLIQLKSCSFQWEQRCPSTSDKKDPSHSRGCGVPAAVDTQSPPPASHPHPHSLSPLRFTFSAMEVIDNGAIKWAELLRYLSFCP